MRRMFIALTVLLLALSAPNLFAADINPPKRGYFQDSAGQKCWYETSSTRMKHFCSLEQNVCVHTFESGNEMPNDDISKRMIANVVTRFYTGTIFQQDTRFKTNVADWKLASGFQNKGFCIVAENYPLPCVWIDFEESKDSKRIMKVFHSEGLPF